jgi:hypothetical protein
MNEDITIVGEPRVEDARHGGRRRFVFKLSSEASAAWTVLFREACRRTFDSRWVPAEFDGDELAIEIPPDDLPHHREYLCDRLREAGEWQRAGRPPQ